MGDSAIVSQKVVHLPVDGPQIDEPVSAEVSVGKRALVQESAKLGDD